MLGIPYLLPGPVKENGLWGIRSRRAASGVGTSRRARSRRIETGAHLDCHPTKRRTLGRLAHFKPTYTSVDGQMAPARRIRAKSRYEWLLSVLYKRLQTAWPDSPATTWQRRRDAYERLKKQARRLYGRVVQRQDI